LPEVEKSLAAAGLANSEIFRGRFAPVLHFFVAHLGGLVEVAQACFFDRRDVHKRILAAVVGLDKPKTLSRVEPLHNTCRHVTTPFGLPLQPISIVGHTARKTRCREPGGLICCQRRLNLIGRRISR
jgi:hypothetical protein